VRGALLANGLLYAVDVAPTTRAAALVTLGGGIGGAIAGFRIGRGLTDSEAKASTAGSSFLGLTTLGVLGTAGVLDDEGSARPAIAAAVAAAVAGYPVGLRYPRRARYTVTSGDVDMLRIGATLGVMTVLTPFVNADVSEQTIWGAGTAGLVAGVLIGDRAFVRPYDHTPAEAAQVGLGATAGALIGLGAATLAEADEQLALGLATLGAILGTVAAEQLVAPQRAEQTPSDESSRRRRPGRFRFAPMSIGLTAAGARGQHPILTVSF
jgi:hypothetical protein